MTSSNKAVLHNGYYYIKIRGKWVNEKTYIKPSQKTIDELKILENPNRAKRAVVYNVKHNDGGGWHKKTDPKPPNDADIHKRISDAEKARSKSSTMFHGEK